MNNTDSSGQQDWPKQWYTNWVASLSGGTYLALDAGHVQPAGLLVLSIDLVDGQNQTGNSAYLAFRPGGSGSTGYVIHSAVHSANVGPSFPWRGKLLLQAGQTIDLVAGNAGWNVTATCIIVPSYAWQV